MMKKLTKKSLDELAQVMPVVGEKEQSSFSMKRKWSFILSIAAFFVTGYSHAQYFPVDTAKLNTAYRELVNKPNTPDRQIAFFNAFPDTWGKFVATYQFISDGKYDLTMYNLAERQVEALDGRVTLIKDSIYCKKLVNIAVGATLEADAPNSFQGLLHRIMWKRMDGMLHQISLLRRGHQMQFWQFYWSNIVKSGGLETEYKRLLKLNSDSYPEQMKIMSIAFEYFYDGVNFTSVGFLN